MKCEKERQFSSWIEGVRSPGSNRSSEASPILPVAWSASSEEG
jgi:hypothetical protein